MLVKNIHTFYFRYIDKYLVVFSGHTTSYLVPSRIIIVGKLRKELSVANLTFKTCAQRWVLDSELR